MPSYGARSLVEESYQALDNHLRYWSWIGTVAHREMTEGFLSTYSNGRHTTPEAVQWWMEAEHSAWDAAPTIVLDPEVHRIVTEASESMPETPFDVSLLPMPSGALMMPDGGVILDYTADHDRETGRFRVPVSAIVWNLVPEVASPGTDGQIQSQPGLHVWLYNPIEYARETARNEGTELPARFNASPFWLTDMPPWASGQGWTALSDYKPPELRGATTLDANGNIQTDPHVATLRRFLMALWVFMADEIVVPERQHLPRPLRRRLDRERPDLHDGMLRIAHLRKMRYLARGGEGDPDAEPVKWSHRWWVRGHQRKLASGEVTYVRPYIKGPEDKPLVLKNDIISVRR